MKTVHLLSALAPLLFVLGFLPACGGGGGGEVVNPTQPTLVLNTGTATGLDVDATTVTFEAGAGGFTAVQLAGPPVIHGQRHGDHFYIWCIPLVPGDNALRFEGTTTDGKVVTRELVLHNAATPHPAISLQLEPLIHAPGASLTVAITPREGIVATDYLVDLDADGNPEASGALGAAPIAFSSTPASGLQLRVALRATDTLIYSNAPAETPQLEELPAPQAIAGWDIPPDLGGLVDAETESEESRTWVLSSSQRALHQFDSSGAHTAAVALGALQDPCGFGLAPEGDVYVVDRALGQVIRLLKSNAYAADPTFAGDGTLGQSGSGRAELLEPTDVCIAEDVVTGAPRVCVADTGNARIQVFSTKGAFVRELRGPAADPLVAPARIVTVSGSAVAVTCSAQGRVRLFSLSGEELPGWGGASTRAPGASIVPDCLAVDATRSELWLHDAASASLLVYTLNGALRRQIPVSQSVLCLATLAPQEGRQLLLGSDGRSLGSLHPFTLPQDATGKSPSDAAQAFFAQLLTGDVLALLPLCDLTCFAMLHYVNTKDPNGWTEFIQAATQPVACTTVFEGTSNASVRCEFSTASGPSIKHMLLVRDPRTRAWLVMRI